MTNKVLEIITGRDLVIPSVLLKNKDTLKISSDEVIFLAYLMSLDKEISLNINKIYNDIGFSNTLIMTLIPSLCEKNYIKIEVKKENNKSKEYINIENLYHILLAIIIDEEVKEDTTNNNSKIYEKIEKEFGRTLSPIEYGTIKDWIDSKISEELIEEALKETVLNGVNNLKYMDRILCDWTKKGYKSKKDIKKKRIKDEKYKNDVFDYNWLEENE